MSSFYITSVVRGYHVYKSVWCAVVGDQLSCAREPGNCRDTFAVAIIKEGITVGHVPRNISPVCSIFLRRGGMIVCRVTSHRRYSAELPQGGMEIPCTLMFHSNDVQLLDKTRNSLNKASSAWNEPQASPSAFITAAQTCLVSSQPSQITSQPQPSQITSQPSQKSLSHHRSPLSHHRSPLRLSHRR